MAGPYTCRRSAGLLGLAVILAAAGVLTGGCGSGSPSESGTAEETAAVPTSQPQMPPIDLRAPMDYETASFALG